MLARVLELRGCEGSRISSEKKKKLKKMRAILISAGIVAAVGVGLLTHSAARRPCPPHSYDQLTPETVIEWCGLPLQDKVESNPEIPSVKYRTLVYRGTEEGVYFNGSKMGLEKSPYSNVVQVEINKRDRHLNLNCAATIAFGRIHSAIKKRPPGRSRCSTIYSS